MDQLYTWTVKQLEGLEIEGKSRHYHGEDYCRRIVESLDGWKEKNYIGSIEQIANETFELVSDDNSQYSIAFKICTYKEQAARLEVTISAPDTDDYDQKLEGLKLALKNKLVSDWKECTWLVDEQAAKLCKEAFEQAFIIENKLRSFASKILIHFLGVNWLQRAGLEKEAESVTALKERFVQRVPEFENINADFLSMTLETLVGIMFDGIVYKDDLVLGKQDYKTAIDICAKAQSTSNIADFLKKRRIVDKTIWTELFVPFIDDSDAFKSSVHDFIEDRNHIAHSKVLSWNAYTKILKDYQTFGTLIDQASVKFEQEETSEELLETWDAEHEYDNNQEYEEECYRERLASETGIEILDEDDISDWFEEVLHNLYSEVFQRYHFDVCYELSDFTAPMEGGIVFSVSCAVEDDLSISVCAEYSVDDDLGGDSICYIVVKNSTDEVLSKAEIRFHNGNGSEGEEGLMEADEDSEYDTSEYDDLKNELFEAIDSLNPYPAKADAIAYDSKGAAQVVADFPCGQCGKFGVSVNEELLPIGKCCYCGYENELERCQRCGEIVDADSLEDGFCPSCVAYIEKQ